MLKNVNLMIVPAAMGLCLTLVGCNNEPSAQTTGQTAGSVSEVQSDTASALTANQDAEQAALEARRERAAQDAPTRESREEAARMAREAAITDRAERASRAAEVRSRPSVIAVEPSLIDVGTMPTGERRSGTVQLTNTSDTMVRFTDCRTSCGCTVANCPKNYDMAPGETIEVEVTLSGGMRAERLTKNVTFLFEDHPHVVAQVTGEAIAYVSISPSVIDPEQNPEGRIEVRSHDDEPFRIVSISPMIVIDVPTEAATEHVFHVSWEEWAELHQPRRLSIELDHPQSNRVMASIRAPRREVIDGRAGRHDSHDREQLMAERTQQQQRVAAVHDLAQTGMQDELMRRITEEGVSVDSVDPRGMNLLGIAARHGHVDLMKALLEAGADANHVSRVDGRTPLMTAAESKKVETIRLLLDADADPNAEDAMVGGTPLFWAAISGNAETVAALLEAGAKVETAARATGWTPLICAAGFSEPESVKLLLDAGAQVNIVCTIQGASPLMYAATTGSVENARLLLAAGAELEVKEQHDDRTPLLVAAANAGANAETIQLLLDAGADVTATDRHGRNALELANMRSDPRRDEVIAVLKPLFKD